MHHIAARFGLIATVAVLGAAKVAAQQAPSAAGQNLQRDAGGEEAAARRVVDGIMQPYLAQEQRSAGARRWIRSPHLGAIVAVSLHGHRYFFPYGKATDAGALFTRETLVEIGSCTKTFTTTLFALAITLRPTPEQQRRLAQGHNRAGQDAPRWYAAGGPRLHTI